MTDIYSKWSNSVKTGLSLLLANISTATVQAVKHCHQRWRTPERHWRFRFFSAEINKEREHAGTYRRVCTSVGKRLQLLNARMPSQAFKNLLLTKCCIITPSASFQFCQWRNTHVFLHILESPSTKKQTVYFRQVEITVITVFHCVMFLFLSGKLTAA